MSRSGDMNLNIKFCAGGAHWPGKIFFSVKASQGTGYFSP